jgi:hypothetical protein
MIKLLLWGVFVLVVAISRGRRGMRGKKKRLLLIFVISCKAFFVTILR